MTVQGAINAATHGSVAGSILSEAAGIVGGARNTTHGDKERSFQVIADLWNAYIDGRKTPGPITPFDVAQFMVLLKIGRSIQGQPVRDHFVDAAGYSGIAGELANLNEGTKPWPYSKKQKPKSPPSMPRRKLPAPTPMPSRRPLWRIAAFGPRSAFAPR